MRSLDPVIEAGNYSLVSDIRMHQVGSHIIVVRIDDIDLVDKITFLETQHSTWVRKVQGAVVLIEIP